MVEIRVRRGTEADAERVAELAVIRDDRVTFPSATLGASTAVVARGRPLFAAGVFGAQAWSASYRVRADGSDVQPSLNIRGVPGGPELIDVMRFSAVHTEPLTIDGREGILYAGWDAAKGPWGGLWQATDGQMIQVAGYASREQTVEALGEVRMLDRAGWQQLVEAPRPRCS